jgi:hypothetical protein
VVSKWATAADRKRLTAALEKLCKAEGGDICSRMAILYVEPGKAHTYDTVIQKYAQYR